MFEPGVYPASVTPMTPDGKIDLLSVAKLLAYFESAGCKGVVLAGTNGEGPSLSAVEKRDLLRESIPMRGQLKVILGVATPSLDEAIWLSKRAHEFEASAILLMPPSYFRSVSEAAIVKWFLTVVEKSPVPALIYNFPKMTGVTISPAMMTEIGAHPNVAGCKDSSGEISNLTGYREALKRPEQVLFVGNELLLLGALRAGWTGTISGAANSVPKWLSQIVAEYVGGQTESAETKFEILRPVLEEIRSLSQPANHKAFLQNRGILARSSLRLPLESVEFPQRLGELVKDRLGN